MIQTETPSSRAADVVWDLIVIGTGMGGGTLGYALAAQGRRVLFVERGRSSLAEEDEAIRNRLPDDRDDLSRLSLSQRLELLARGGRSTAEIIDQSRGRPTPFTPFIGAGTGGSSALYGMALERLFEEDFNPRSNHMVGKSSTLPESWPIEYSKFRPWYAAAERLYRVHGSPDPLRPQDADAPLIPSPPLTTGNAELFAHFQSQGLHPYQLHIGCEHLPECQTCQGYLCPRACKNDSGRICLAPAIADHGAGLLTDTTVLRLEADRRQVRQVICKSGGQEITLRARYVVLAAGALFTPVILLESRSSDWPRGLANESGLVGRNLMRHCVDLLMVLLKRDEPIRGQIKELAMNDFYLVDGQRLGTLQSFGPLPPISYFLSQPSLLNRALGMFKPLLCRLGESFRSRGLVLTTIMEDLPYAENRVLPRESFAPSNTRQRVRLFYRLSKSEQQRLKKFRALIEQALRPYRLLRLRGAADNKAIAHVCGTCRFGHDPRDSVLDADCRAHAVDNLYVADASFLPSSGGMNPSLTIAANALRIAEHLKDRF